ncbi:hypothetical protein B0T24DRAFT_393602 [Lasiosphaeria ovina]|uniref:SRR1-like domain-containing protein n=1 Tax=Lasiosphaeria ovina TaxID=92902 RepID=A0AAE0JX23_9PEZI|nr:hypothetical protein B0T24DRAFT_393602 [Lasiosphaeria ovina]
MKPNDRPGHVLLPVQIQYKLRWRHKTDHTRVIFDESPDMDATQKYFKKCYVEWGEGKENKAIAEALSEINLPTNIRYIVGFGLGSIAIGNENGPKTCWERKKRCNCQHAMLLNLRDALQPHSKENIICIAQDPAYDETDVDVLDAVDIIILNDPDGLMVVTPNSVVVSIHPTAPVRAILADFMVRPAMFICDKLKDLSPSDPVLGSHNKNNTPTEDWESARVRLMLEEEYELIYEPPPDPGVMLFNIGFYLRKDIATDPVWLEAGYAADEDIPKKKPQKKKRKKKVYRLGTFNVCDRQTISI